MCVFNSEWDRYREKEEGREWGEERERDWLYSGANTFYKVYGNI